MLNVLRRAHSILQREGFTFFVNKLARYIASYIAYKLCPDQDRKNTNWHLYIKELDARAEIMKSTPWKLSLESTSVCNMQCIMCQHVFMHPREGSHFPCAILSKIEDYIAKAGEFQLMGHGEPLVSPSFWQIMEYIKKHHTKWPFISISSNGAAMTPHIVKKILRSPLAEMSISLDAATPDTYRKIRNSDFQKTVSNITFLMESKKALGLGQPRVMLNMTLMRENIDELLAFIDLAQTIGADAVQFWPLHDYDPKRTADWRVERNGWVFEYRKQMLGQNTACADHANARIAEAEAKAQALGLEVIWPVGGRTHITVITRASAKGADSCHAKQATEPVHQQTHSVLPTHSLRECVAPWEWMAINHLGEVHPCCYVEQSFGNIHTQTPEEIWNGHDYRRMRRSLAAGVLPPQCRGAACKYARGSWIYAQKN